MRNRVVSVLAALLVVACAGGEQAEPPPVGSPTSTELPTTSREAAPDTAVTSSTRAPSITAAAPSTTTTTTTLPPLQSLAYQEVAPAEFPTFVTARPGDEVALVALRGGRVHTLADGELGEVILDLSGRTTVDGERGLLGLARHPDDDTGLFVHYTDGAGDTVVSEFTLGEDLTADPGSERVLLAVDQPAANHNGGMIQFGPDGALYLGLGDGGGAGDRFGNGQNRDTLLGGLVRIDVASGDSELWQYGLRNPWRFWIDGEQIWIADVGQGSYEEIDLADVTDQGVNYGWPIMEGAHCYRSSDCDTADLRLPIAEVAHGHAGTCSITGGMVYAGRAIPELRGRFLFSDYCGGYLRSVDREGEVVDHTDEVGVPGRVVSFGIDGAGEIYVLTTDRVLRLVARR